MEFDKQFNEMLVLINKKKDGEENKAIEPETIPTDGFTNAVNDLMSTIAGDSPNPHDLIKAKVLTGSDEPAPADEIGKSAPASEDEDEIETGESDGNLEVGDGQVGFEKDGDKLRIVFKDASITLSGKSLMALRDFIDNSYGETNESVDGDGTDDDVEDVEDGDEEDIAGAVDDAESSGDEG